MRVTVLGNSCAMVTARGADGVRGRTYAEHLRDDPGADVLNASRFGRTITASVRDWESAVLAHRPDLVVVHHGVLEARPAVQPMALLRWAYAPGHRDSAPSRLGVRAARRVQRHLRRGCRLLERAVVLPGHLGADRFGRQLERLLRLTDTHLGVPVAVVDLPPATPFLLTESPGYAARRAALQRALEQVVARHPRAYRVGLAGLEERLGVTGVYGDGIHFTAAAHAEVARLVAAGSRPHLIERASRSG